MACSISLSTRSMCSRHISIFVFATLLFWLPGCILPCGARVVRTYRLVRTVGKDISTTMDELKAACKSQANGVLPVADSVEKEGEISRYLAEVRPTLPNVDVMFFPLGGMMVSNRPDGRPPQSIQEARWCWSYGDDFCGPNNETLIGTYRDTEFVTSEGRYSNWRVGHPGAPDGSVKVIALVPFTDGWYSFYVTHNITFACVLEERLPDASGAPTANVTAPTAPPKKSLWWIALIVVAVVLVIVVVIVCVVCRYCCGAGAPVEEEYKSEDDGHMSVRETRSNHSLVSRGGTMRSMGSRRSSAYSSSQCYSQDDMEVDKSYGDDRVYQGRSGASYYY